LAYSCGCCYRRNIHRSVWKLLACW
jgi:hypothetical protein